MPGAGCYVYNRVRVCGIDSSFNGGDYGFDGVVFGADLASVVGGVDVDVGGIEDFDLDGCDVHGSIHVVADVVRAAKVWKGSRIIKRI